MDGRRPGWAVAGGLAVGALVGTLVGQLVIYLRRKHREALGLDEFLSLGLIGLSYGLALAAHALASWQCLQRALPPTNRAQRHRR